MTILGGKSLEMATKDSQKVGFLSINKSANSQNILTWMFAWELFCNKPCSLGVVTMLTGISIELRHGGKAEREAMRALLETRGAIVLDGSACPACIVVDLEPCNPCSRVCDGMGPTVTVEGEQGVWISVRVNTPDCEEELIDAVLMIARAACMLPKANHDPPIAISVIPALASALSDREHQVILRILDGKSNKIIARELGITETTVKVHMKSILRKTGTANRTQAALWAIANHNAGHDIAKKPGDLSIAG